MHTLLKAKVGPFLVISSVLAAWTLLAAQPVQAQSAPSAPPGCPSSTIIRNISDAATETVDEAIPDLSGTLENDDDPSTTDVNERVRTLYFKLTVPALTAGELTVTEASGSPRTVGRLCRGGSTLIVHPRSASSDAADEDEPDFMAENVPVTPGDYYVVVSGQNVDAAGVRQSTPDEGAVTLTVSFNGVRPTTAGTSAVGSLSSRGERDSFALTTSINGLLTVRTTGSTDTKGTFTGSGTDMEVTADDGGSGRNFQIIAPVTAGAKTVFVDGQIPTETGDYTLDVAFEVATPLTLSNIATPETDDTTDGEIKSGEAEHFFFVVGGTEQGLMTIQTEKHADIASGAGTPTRGTLYGPKGLITMDDNSGAGGNFRLSVPVAEGNYIVKVDGQGSGPYTLRVSNATATALAPGATTDSAVTVTPPTGTANPHVGYYYIAVTTAGTLQMQTTGGVDTVGELYGPDGGLIATDEDSGQDGNFKSTQFLMPGGYIVVVRAADRMTAGSYNLKTGFIEGEVASAPPTEPVDPGECPEPEPFPVDATGALENPSGGGFRSGIGVISGWVCSANEVEVVISSNDRQGSARVTLAVAYGTSRPDTVGHCGHNDPNTGFGMTYNFNHLREGEYTMRAFADGEELIGAAQTFNVVHLTTFAVNDDDRFLRDEDGWSLQGTECRVNDFPELGEATILEWEQSTQNFMIIDAGPVSQ